MRYDEFYCKETNIKFKFLQEKSLLRNALKLKEKIHKGSNILNLGGLKNGPLSPKHKGPNILNFRGLENSIRFCTAGDGRRRSSLHKR